MKENANPDQALTGDQSLSRQSIGSSNDGSKTADFPVVGIGASAGGLEALEQFFSNMPNFNGMAFVVIQHLDPTREGIMPELLQRITPMKVVQATDRLKVKPNCVYVIPPNKSLSFLNGSLHLFEPTEMRGLRLPIDIFFRSLADDQEDKSIGVVLSGMGSDGSLGLKAIKEKNGLVLVQDPETARFNGMPNSAIEAVIPDIVAPADELPSNLIELLRFVPAAKLDPEKERKIKSNLDKIVILIRERSGHDFSHYKKSTIFRRVERRKNVNKMDKLSEYVKFLQENPDEIDILFKELLIGVTSFFRDGLLWEMLKDVVFPTLLQELPDGYTLRAWVPGCSTGEEAYSMAIIFKEALEKAKIHKVLNLQIFASDLDQTAIEKARKGVFSKNIAGDVSMDRLSRFFTPDVDGYRVNSNIREMVVFATQNVIKDPPFTKLDILSCRNMLIYMESELQRKLMALFNYSLNPGGIMVLGTAETPGPLHEGFREIDGKLKIFKRAESSLASELIDFPSSFHHHKAVVSEKMKQPKVVDNIQSIAEQILLQKFTPAGALVNEKGDILYISGRTGKFLEPVAGKANWNIHVMAREGLRQILPAGFRHAIHSLDPVITRNIKIGTNGDSQFADITIQRVEVPNSGRIFIMVVFSDSTERFEKELKQAKPGKQSSSARMKALEIELQRSYEELQSTREEMQTSQEELKSTNEELQSTNEELQSTNEELTTSKEEMQSLNEELQTVNAELQIKVSDFIRASDDMKNLLNSTGIATLFLDRGLNIRRYTDQVTKIIKLRDTDIGRPITDLVTDLDYPDLHHNALQVIKSLTPIETANSTRDGRWFDVRILPYRTLEDRIDGLVITFTDISAAKKLESELKESEQIFRELIEKSPDPCFISDFTGSHDNGFIDCNKSALRIMGMNSKKQVLAINLLNLSPEQQPDGQFSRAKYTEMVARAIVHGSAQFEWELTRPDGRKFSTGINISIIESNGRMLLHSVWHGLPMPKA